MWYTRYFEKNPTNLFKNGKVTLFYGARRVGKTALILKCLENKNTRVFIGSGDDIELSDILGSRDATHILSVFANYNIVFIDEAQQIPNIGLGLKILIDNKPELSIIATGSSAFDLSTAVGEPLTGRSYIYQLYSLSMLEIASQFGNFEVVKNVENYLLFGSYPEVLSIENIDEKKNYLINLRNSYLFKDILVLDNVKNSAKLIDLLRLIAFQIGHEVSLNELAKKLGIAKQTVHRYLDLLEKTFIIKKVAGFSRNLRKEVAKSNRYYFYDNGVRNAVINNFNPLAMRNDIGMLWENFLFMERFKKQAYQSVHSNVYYWRTYDKKEIDLVEERGGKLFGYEFKYGSKKVKAPKVWLETYDNASWEVVNKENFLNFVL